MKQVTHICPIDIVPDGKDANGNDVKRIVLLNVEAGEVHMYGMEQELATKVAKQLRMTNEALQAEKEREAARARIAVPDGPVPADVLRQNGHHS